MNSPLDWLAEEDEQAKAKLVSALNQAERNEFDFNWPLLAREAQLAPPGDWRTWLIMAGRGFGKTRAGAEWVRSIAEANSEARIALVSASLSEARSVMIEGESGIMACSPPDRLPVFESSVRRVRFPSGALAQIFSAAEPDSLRGPQHSHALWTSAKGDISEPSHWPNRYSPTAKHRWNFQRAANEPTGWAALQGWSKSSG